MEKPGNSWQLMFENWKSLGIFSSTAKTDTIDHLVRHYEVDTVARCKTQCNWSHVESSNLRFHKVLMNNQKKKSTVGNNTTEEKGVQNQMGETTMMTIGRLSNGVIESRCDHTVLGRWLLK